MKKPLVDYVQLPKFEEYRVWFKDYFDMRREDGILEVTMKTGDHPMNWSGGAHRAMSQLTRVLSLDHENEILIWTHQGPDWMKDSDPNGWDRYGEERFQHQYFDDTNLIKNMIFVCYISAGTLQVGTLYYFQYVLGDLTLFMPVMLGTVVTAVIGIFLSKILRKRTGKVLAIGCFGGAICLLLEMINTGTSTVATFLFIDLAAMFGITMTMTAFAPMAGNTIEYGEWKTGIRAEGITSAVVNVGIKVGTALAATVLGAVMAAGGFQEGGVEQTAEAVRSIWIGYLVVPAVLFATIGVFFMFTYDLDRRYPEIMADL